MTKNKFKINLLATSIRSLLMSSAGLLALNINTIQAAEENDDGAEGEGNKVVITGSRIRRGGFESAEPVDIINAADARLQGIDSLAELLRQTTVASGSPQITSATSSASVQNGGIGANTLSLRGLGANRTLVLLNGRRAGPAGTRGGVSAFDLSTIPLSAVERVEILKDGASSLYGSDAVAGVVNIITKKQDGGMIDIFGSIPEKSGGEDFRISGTWGQTWDKGSFMATADYSLQKELAKGDRDYFDCGEAFLFDSTTGARADAIDPRTGDPICRDALWGHVWIYDYQGPGGNVPSRSLAQFDRDGDLGNFIPGYAVDSSNDAFLTAPAGWFPVRYDLQSDGVTDYDAPFQDQSSLIPEVEKITLFLQGDYDINDANKVYAEALINRRTTYVNSHRQFWQYSYNGNWDFATGLNGGGGNSLNSDWRGAQWLSPTAITDHADDSITVDYQRFVFGITGDLGNSDWYYDVSLSTSHSDGEYRGDFIYNDAIKDQAFASGSCVGQTTSVAGVACIDVPWLDPDFLAGNIDQASRDFLFGVDTGRTVYTQQTFEGFISGDLMELPAGTLDVAIGFSYRVDEILDTPGEASRTGNAWGSSSAGITAGDNATTAFFGEAIIPLLADIPMVNSLELRASARYTDVSSFGADTTFKLGLNWEVTDTVRIRAAHGTSFRSPALFELFLADQTSFVSQRAIDPCIQWAQELNLGNISQRTADNCAAEGLSPTFAGAAISATVITGGGAGVLDAETSISESWGIVWTPKFADLAISLDRFDFEINGEVSRLGAGVILGRCYDSVNFPADPLCQQFDRDPLDSKVTDVRDSFLNIAQQINSGYDLRINYGYDLEFGKLRLSVEHTYQDKDTTALFEDTVRNPNGTFGNPRRTAVFRANLQRDDWSYNWTVNYTGSVSNTGEDFDDGNKTTYRGQNVIFRNSADAQYYHAFSTTYDYDEHLNVVVGVANAFNQKPPRISTFGTGVSNQGDSAFYSQYDWRARRFFLNLAYKF